MPSGFTLSLIILAVLSASLYFLLQANGGIDQLPLLLEQGIESYREESN